MNKWKRMGSLAVAAVLLAGIVGCGNSSSSNSSNGAQTETPSSTVTAASKAEPVKLKIYTQYSDDSEKQPLDYAIAEMKKIMPEVDLEIENEARDDNQKLKTYAAAGNLPDIFRATLDVIDAFKTSGNILQLDDYVKQSGLEDRMLVTEKPRLRIADGHIYAIPTNGSDYAMLYYNKKVFAQYNVKPPTNYDEFLQAVKTFSQNKITPLALFAKEKWPGIQLFDMIASRKDPKGVNDLDIGTAKASDPAFKEAADRMFALAKAGMLSKSVFNTDSDAAHASFEEGKSAMLLNGGWATSDLGPKMGDNVGILYPYPFSDAGSAEAGKFSGSGGSGPEGLAVSPFSSHKDIAAKYAVGLAEKIAEGRVVKRAAPAMTKDSAKPEMALTAVQKQYLDIISTLKSGTTFPWGIGNAKIKTALEDNVQSLLVGDDKFNPDMFDKTVDDVINRARK